MPEPLVGFEVRVVLGAEVDPVLVDDRAGFSVQVDLGGFEPDRPVPGLHCGNGLVGQARSGAVLEVVGRDVGLVVPAGTLFENRVPLRGVVCGGLGVAGALLPVGAQLGDPVRELVGACDLDQLGLGLVIPLELHEAGGFDQVQLSGVQSAHRLLGLDGSPQRRSACCRAISVPVPSVTRIESTLSRKMPRSADT